MSFFLLLNIHAILKNVENQTVAGPQWFPYEMRMKSLNKALKHTRTAADGMCAVAR